MCYRCSKEPPHYDEICFGREIRKFITIYTLAWWLIGRVLDLRRCDVSLRKSRHSILCLVLIQPKKTGNHHNMTRKIVDWDVKHQHKQTLL